MALGKNTKYIKYSRLKKLRNSSNYLVVKKLRNCSSDHGNELLILSKDRGNSEFHQSITKKYQINLVKLSAKRINNFVNQLRLSPNYQPKNQDEFLDFFKWNQWTNFATFPDNILKNFVISCCNPLMNLSFFLFIRLIDKLCDMFQSLIDRSRCIFHGGKTFWYFSELCDIFTATQWLNLPFFPVNDY